MLKCNPWDMSNEKSVFMGENGNVFFDSLIITCSPDQRVHRVGSQLKKSFWVLVLVLYSHLQVKKL